MAPQTNIQKSNPCHSPAITNINISIIASGLGWCNTTHGFAYYHPLFFCGAKLIFRYSGPGQRDSSREKLTIKYPLKRLRRHFYPPCYQRPGTTFTTSSYYHTPTVRSAIVASLRVSCSVIICSVRLVHNHHVYNWETNNSVSICWVLRSIILFISIQDRANLHDNRNYQWIAQVVALVVAIVFGLQCAYRQIAIPFFLSNLLLLIIRLLKRAVVHSRKGWTNSTFFFRNYPGKFPRVKYLNRLFSYFFNNIGCYLIYYFLVSLLDSLK